MSSLQTYLASKYMSGPKADAILSRSAPKKKKRKHSDNQNSTEKSVIVDNDGGWGNASIEQEEEGEREDVIVASDRSFKKRNTGQTSGNDSGWITVTEPSPPPTEDEQPVVVETKTEGESFKGGLVTVAQLRKQRASQPAPVMETRPAEEQETVYRDVSGRRIDTKAEKAEAARKKREKEELEARKMEWGKGLVQREEVERNRAQMLAESMKDLAR
jgi:pre-mRNA-splicing factor CWC26